MLLEGVIKLSKILQLYKNEITKIIRKKSVIILMIIMIVLVFGYGALMKFSASMVGSVYTNESWVTNQIESTIDDTDKTIEEINTKLEETSSEDEKSLLKYQLELNQIELEYYNLAIDNNIDIFTGNTFQASLLNIIKENKIVLLDKKYDGTYEADTEIVNASLASIAKCTEIINNNDYVAFLEFQSENIKNDESLSSEEKKIELERLELLEKADPKGEGLDMVTTALNTWSNAKKSLIDGVNYVSASGQGALLSADDEKELKDKIAVIEYKLQNNLYSDSKNMIEDSTISSMISIGILMIVILVMILAGGTISSEISSGSIKSLIISPTKRWKIYLSKLLAITSLGIVCMFLTYIVAIIANLIFFGAEGMVPYVYASGGNVHTIPFLLYQLAYSFVDFIEVFVFLVFALMLSIVTRNTAASVGISIGVYFGGNIAFAILTQFVKGEWLKFIPFNNFGLSVKIFPNSSVVEYASTVAGDTMSLAPSLTFSVVYLILIVFCMLLVGYDSFTKKDI